MTVETWSIFAAGCVFGGAVTFLGLYAASVVWLYRGGRDR